jgi:putative NADPH-quinone reductase
MGECREAAPGSLGALRRNPPRDLRPAAFRQGRQLVRVLVLHAHPVAESFSAALCGEVVARLRAMGREVDVCDLYAENFDPVLTADERRAYHDLSRNTAAVQGYVDRLRAAQALVIVAPVWNYGWPAILKGFFDRVFLPGVSFRMADGQVEAGLTHVRRLAVVTTYGGTRLRTWLAGDPPRKIAKRTFRFLCRPDRLRYLALYDMNRATGARRAAFLARVGVEMDRL